MASKGQEMDFQELRHTMNSFADQISNSKTSKTITREKFDRIVSHLNNQTISVDPHFRAWVKKRKFAIQNIPALEITNALIVPSDEDTDPARLGSFKRVIPVDKVFDVIHQLRCQELQHAGYKKVLEKVNRMFYGIPRSYIQEFCKNCPVCQLSVPQTVRPPLRPILASGFLNRVQVDLIDMRHDPDGDYKWIGHFMDHFSKFHVLFPLTRKTAQEVAEKLQERVLSYLGVPRIFHSDNGREFVNELLHALFEQWGGDVLFIRGRPRHSESQGLVENGNKTLERRMAAMKAEKQITGNTPWSTWLPRIQYGLNVTAQEAIKETPYAVVFGQQPQSSFVPGSTVRIIDEEDIDDYVKSTEETVTVTEVANKPIPAPRKRKVADSSPVHPVPVKKPVPAPRMSRPKTATPIPAESVTSTEPETIPADDDAQDEATGESVTPTDLRTSIRNAAMKNYKNNAEKMKEISKEETDSSC
jgi:transposase InsO family protein